MIECEKCYNKKCEHWRQEQQGLYLQNHCNKWGDIDYCDIKITKEKKESALDTQVGGGHYKDLAIQPIEFTHKNNLNFCQGNIVKYVTRYKSKNGIEDLQKVIHYAELLIELEYGKQ